MTDKELLAKAERNEGLTVDEIKRYQNLVKPQKHVYGRLKTSPNIFTAWTSKPRICTTSSTQNSPTLSCTSVRASLWKITAG